MGGVAEMGRAQDYDGSTITLTLPGLDTADHGSNLAISRLQAEINNAQGKSVKELGAVAFDALFSSERDGGEPGSETLLRVAACSLVALVKGLDHSSG